MSAGSNYLSNDMMVLGESRRNIYSILKEIRRNNLSSPPEGGMEL